MADRAVGVTDQASGAGVADIRTRERTVGGNTVDEQYIIPISERVASYKGSVSTFRTLGRAAVAQNLGAIFNAAGSTVLVAVRRASIQMDATAVLTAVVKSIKTSRITTLPTNGTALTANKVPFDTALSSSASVTLHGDASADGTNSGTTLTATPGTTLWSQFVMRMHTLAGQVLMDDESLIPALCEDDPIILRAGEGLLFAVSAAVTTSNPATDHHILNIFWEEFTLP